MGTQGSSPWGRVARSCSWPLASN